MAQSPKAILFDLDGVLIDSEPLHHRAYEAALAPYGVNGIPLVTYAEQFTNRGRGLTYAEETYPGVRAEVLHAEKRVIYLDLLRNEVALRPGARAALRALSRRWPLALATNEPREEALFVLERFDLRESFSAVVTRENYARQKPAPDPFLEAARALEVPAEGCLVVEDAAKGLVAALAAGMPCVIVPNDYTRSADFSGAAAILDSLEALTAERIERIFA